MRIIAFLGFLVVCLNLLLVDEASSDTDWAKHCREDFAVCFKIPKDWIYHELGSVIYMRPKDFKCCAGSNLENEAGDCIQLELSKGNLLNSGKRSEFSFDQKGNPITCSASDPAYPVGEGNWKGFYGICHLCVSPCDYSGEAKTYDCYTAQLSNERVTVSIYGHLGAAQKPIKELLIEIAKSVGDLG
jgi:hypothetical protein